MKKYFFALAATLLSLATMADDLTFDFYGEDTRGNSVELTKVIVENLTQNWVEQLTGPDFSMNVEQETNGLRDISASDGNLMLRGQNPFYGSTDLILNVEKAGDVRFLLTDVAGRTVYSKVEALTTGEHLVTVSISMPQLYQLSITTLTGSYSAKLLNQGIGVSNTITVGEATLVRKPRQLRAAGEHSFREGDSFRFTGYTENKGVEYKDEKAATIYTAGDYEYTFTFDLPAEPDTASLYLGIIGFNDELMTYPLTKMTKNEAANCKAWIDRLDIAVGTILYHADWNALDMLQAFDPPKDLANATLITFTDGLDLGSHQKTDTTLFFYDEDNLRYRDSVRYRIMNDKVADLNLSAYVIGIRGNDVNTPKKIEQFETNLPLLASSEENAYQVSDMDAVNQKFDSIAKSLNKVNTKSDLQTLAVTRNSNTRISWTLDIDTTIIKEWNVGVDTVATSKMFISAAYWRKRGVAFLTDIEYEGVTCTPQDTIWGGEDYKATFVFKDIRDANGDPITSFPLIQEWVREDETENWTVQSEFEKGNDIQAIPQNTSAVIMLSLDCSSSLGETGLDNIKKAAKNFIDIVTSELKNDGGGNGNNDNEETYTVSIQQANSIAQQLESGETTTDSYRLTGYVSAISEINTEYGNATFTLSDGSNTILCYRLNNVGNTLFTSSSQLTLNDRVTVIGKLKNWNGTLELADGYIVSRETSSQLATYYIKHSWGSGADADWTWQPMNYNSAWGAYYYTGAWGGYGVNINTVPSDTGSKWFDMSSVAYNNDWSIGQTITFIYDPSSDTVTYEY